MAYVKCFWNKIILLLRTLALAIPGHLSSTTVLGDLRMMPKHPFQSVKGMWQVRIRNKRISGKPNVIMKTSLKAENKWDITPCLSGISTPGSYGAALEGLSPDLGEASHLELSFKAGLLPLLQSLL